MSATTTPAAAAATASNDERPAMKKPGAAGRNLLAAIQCRIDDYLDPCNMTCEVLFGRGEEPRVELTVVLDGRDDRDVNLADVFETPGGHEPKWLIPLGVPGVTLQIVTAEDRVHINGVEVTTPERNRNPDTWQTLFPLTLLARVFAVREVTELYGTVANPQGVANTDYIKVPVAVLAPGGLHYKL